MNFDGGLSNDSWKKKGDFAYPEPPVGLPYIPDLLPKLVNISIPSIQSPDRRLKPMITSPRRVSEQSQYEWRATTAPSIGGLGIRNLDRPLDRIFDER